jgi:hypothetical protein
VRWQSHTWVVCQTFRVHHNNNNNNNKLGNGFEGIVGVAYLIDNRVGVRRQSNYFRVPFELLNPEEET